MPRCVYNTLPNRDVLLRREQNQSNREILRNSQVSVDPRDTVCMQVDIPSRSQRVQNLQSPVWKLQHEKTATESEFSTILWQSLEPLTKSLQGDIEESELSKVLQRNRGEIVEAASLAALLVIRTLLNAGTGAHSAEETIATRISCIARLDDSEAPDSTRSSIQTGRSKRLRLG